MNLANSFGINPLLFLQQTFRYFADKILLDLEAFEKEKISF